LGRAALRVAIVGCGRIGARRARALAGAQLVCCVDRDSSRAEQLARDAGGVVACSDWQQALDRADVDAVIIATAHDSLARITRAAVLAGKHVLVEKPAARHVAELHELPALAAERRVCVRVGFNHRYHRALLQARRLVDASALGPLMFVRARYGHGGRLGYEHEWRASREQAGGGELLDQGVHLIDLARWFLGEFTEVSGYAGTFFWDMPVEDNGFMLLKTAASKVAFLHASCTDWKNTFSFELFGRTGKLQIEGLGGSYGTERLIWYRMLPEMGPPETTIWEYPMEDNSWDVEMQEFIEDIRGERTPAAGLSDAIAALTVVDRIYRHSAHADHA
jgi:predicted dehydrogenase